MKTLHEWCGWARGKGLVASRSEAAGMLGIAESTLYAYMNGDRRPRWEDALRIARLTGKTGFRVDPHSWYPRK